MSSAMTDAAGVEAPNNTAASAQFRTPDLATTDTVSERPELPIGRESPTNMGGRVRDNWWMEDADRVAAGDPVRLGQLFVEEMRRPTPPDDYAGPWATGLLRWGASELDDETVWTAVVTA